MSEGLFHSQVRNCFANSKRMFWMKSSHLSTTHADPTQTVIRANVWPLLTSVFTLDGVRSRRGISVYGSTKGCGSLYLESCLPLRFSSWLSYRAGPSAACCRGLYPIPLPIDLCWGEVQGYCLSPKCTV